MVRTENSAVVIKIVVEMIGDPCLTLVICFLRFFHISHAAFYFLSQTERMHRISGYTVSVMPVFLVFWVNNGTETLML